MSRNGVLSRLGGLAISPMEALMLMKRGDVSDIQSERGLRILRVHPDLPADHPDRRRTPFASNYLGEFSSHAALRDGQIIVGRVAFDKDDHFPLKTILTYIEHLSGYNTLKVARSSGRISAQMEEESLIRYLEFPRDQAVSAVIGADLTIAAIMISYPNYLGGTGAGLVKYREYYMYLLGVGWKEYEASRSQRIRVNTISEGQATTLCVCEPFYDPLTP